MKTKIIFSIQKILLFSSYYFFYLTSFNKKKIQWVIGVDEIASVIFRLSKCIDNSYSVNFTPHLFYEKFTYNFNIHKYRSIYGPIILGKLINRASGFLYIWSTGFLINNIDNREFEFNFIKSKNKKIVCYFCGNDIRSPRLMLNFQKQSGLENICTYLPQLSPHLLSDSYDKKIRSVAFISEKYSDIIFSTSVDQMSYFTKPTKPFIYVYPDEKIIRNDSKFQNLENLKIVHAPSSPIIKGTPLVRAAIAKLKCEGYSFEYIELINVPNDRVLDELKNAHIVLNQFYAFVPGIFGVEAMSSHCALLTSADESIETDLPIGSNKAWVVTRYFEIYDNLKKLLDNTQLIKPQADAGYSWVKKYAAMSSSGEKLKSHLGCIGT